MKRILSLTLTLMLLISGLCCAMAESVTLDAWQNDAGWTSFAILAQDEALADAVFQKFLEMVDEAAFE